ncbi:MotA/TolQ/ExbB proton channel family protein [Blastopirellula retiformator]|uniref:Biopolymer transport protein ExbB n=1 Tax=Blastopirellula retiformator TaxID=2527970 RepID=A0A5C5V7B2_9BACT|nr:MotA/TolQ/ExbB proton channel family protein [Blastopirellula retiformator]TWT34161.1 Biopolymer transport protein ExbB [Blastopirellula retiformator]
MEVSQLRTAGANLRRWAMIAAFGGMMIAAPALAQEGADALASATESPIPTKNMLQAIQGGGLLMYPIVLCSFLLLVFVFERAISLRAGRVIPRPFVKRFLEQLREGQIDQDEALALCEENKSPVAEVFSAAVKKWGRSTVEVEQAIIDSGERVTNGLRRYLRLFNGISTISPLLGLLGTVLGMIKAFNAIATSDAMGRPELLAAGISQALLTTAAGLTVALPALIAYLFFVGRVDRLVMEIDSLGQDVVNAIASDGWKERRGGAKKSSRRAA